MINVGELKAIRAGPHGQWQIHREMEKGYPRSVKNRRRGSLFAEETHPAKEEAHLKLQSGGYAECTKKSEVHPRCHIWTIIPIYKF